MKERNQLQDAAILVASLSSFIIGINLIMKIAGYSETEWDWELIFLIVDGMAVVSMIYGLYHRSAPYLQPFVVLSVSR